MLKNEREIFEALNEGLKENDIFLTVICVGGFVLSHYGIRGTMDVDGFYRTSKKTEDIIRSVGEKFHINREDELWLNHSVQNMNEEPPEEICRIVYEFSHLKVLIPPLDYIAGMKLYSAREQDVEDVAAVIRKLSLKSPDRLRKKLASYGLNRIDESILLEAFGLAYGMQWLEQYYVANEEKINRRIRESKE